MARVRARHSEVMDLPSRGTDEVMAMVFGEVSPELSSMKARTLRYASAKLESGLLTR